MTARILDGRDLASHLRRELRHRVEALLRAHARAGDFLGTPAMAVFADAVGEELRVAELEVPIVLEVDVAVAQSVEQEEPAARARHARQAGSR